MSGMSRDLGLHTWCLRKKLLARVPLQNLVVKFFPEIYPALLCRVMGIWG